MINIFYSVKYQFFVCKGNKVISIDMLSNIIGNNKVNIDVMDERSEEYWKQQPYNRSVL